MSYKNQKPRWRASGVATLLCLAAVSAMAGVLAPGDAPPADAGKAANDVLKSSKLGSESQTSRAVDLLIDLQPRSPGVDFKERHFGGSGSTARATSARPVETSLPNGAATVAATPAPAVNKAGLFGTQATPSVAREVPTASSVSARSSDLATQRGDSNRPQLRGDVPWWMHPAGWIDAVREQRAWLLALLVVALLGWAGTRMLSGRWR
jgi:hypothetical protein